MTLQPDQMLSQYRLVEKIGAQGNRVVGHGHYVWHVKGTGREWQGDYAHIITVDGDKIVSFQETAAAY